jgi:hypothetical protein
MTDKSEKIAKLILIGSGAAISIFLIAKYHKSIIKKFSRTKELMYDLNIAKRTKFDVEIINDPKDCKKLIDNLRE